MPAICCFIIILRHGCERSSSSKHCTAGYALHDHLAGAAGGVSMTHTRNTTGGAPVHRVLLVAARHVALGLLLLEHLRRM
jgi:hypothetical protein